MKAWICLGSNLDNPYLQLERAIKYLKEKCYIDILRIGKLAYTKPFGYKDQPEFTNQLLEIDTPLSPRELLLFLKTAESELGRKPSFKWGPRSIDMDIVLFEDRIISEDDLTIPHPGIAEREYLLSLLNEMIPEYIHPELHKSINRLYMDFGKKGGS